MSAPKKITAKHLQKLTVEYETVYNRIVETLNTMADNDTGRARFAADVLHKRLHELHDAVAEREQGKAAPVAGDAEAGRGGE